jgi:hypothetical protein
MSSSSSIAAARRRRAGGPPGPTPPGSNSSRPSPNNTPNRQPEPPAGPINPLMLLQQHHIKITMMEQVLKDLVSKQELSKNDASKNAQVSAQVSAQVNAPVAANRQMTEQSLPSQLNINELSDLIMSRMEAQLDLKAFYENDEKLMTEIEELKAVVQSQQMVINSLNTAVFSLITKLNVSVPTNIVSELDADHDADHDGSIDAEVDGVFKTEVETNSSNVRETLTPTFSKSVMINETNNTVKEFKNDFDEVEQMAYDNSNLTY